MFRAGRLAHWLNTLQLCCFCSSCNTLFSISSPSVSTECPTCTSDYKIIMMIIKNVSQPPLSVPLFMNDLSVICSLSQECHRPSIHVVVVPLCLLPSRLFSCELMPVSPDSELSHSSSMTDTFQRMLLIQSTWLMGIIK